MSIVASINADCSDRKGKVTVHAALCHAHAMSVRSFHFNGRGIIGLVQRNNLMHITDQGRERLDLGRKATGNHDEMETSLERCVLLKFFTWLLLVFGTLNNGTELFVPRKRSGLGSIAGDQIVFFLFVNGLVDRLKHYETINIIVH